MKRPPQSFLGSLGGAAAAYRRKIIRQGGGVKNRRREFPLGEKKALASQGSDRGGKDGETTASYFATMDTTMTHHGNDAPSPNGKSLKRKAMHMSHMARVGMCSLGPKVQWGDQCATQELTVIVRYPFSALKV